MKKIKYLLVSILSLFLLITQVSAEQKSILIEGNDDEYANRVELLDDGDFVVVGEFVSTDIEGLKSNGDYDAYIIKYNKYGEVIWMKNYGGSNYDYFTEVISTSDNGFIAVGQTCSADISNLTLNGGCDALVVKYTNEGNIEWQQTYGTEYNDRFNVVSKSNDGTYLLAGIVNYDSEYDKESYVVNIDETGIKINENKFGDKDITFIIQKLDGGYIIGDYTQNSNVASYDEEFNLIWETNNEIYTYVNGAVLLDDNTIIVVGSESPTENVRTAYIAKYDNDGTMLWKKEYGSEGDSFNGISVDKDGNYIVAGGKKSTINDVKVNTALVVKYDKNGNLIDEEIFQGKDATWFYGLDYISEESYVYVGSSFVSGTTYQEDIFIVYNASTYIFDISLKTEGKGTIEVVPTASAGEEIKFNIIPEEGYKIDKIVVTDSDGKVITFTDYTFTMPSADVTIGVIFVEDVENSETADIAIISCISIIILGGLGTFYSIRKLSWLR